MSQTSIKMADMRGSVVYHSVARNSCMEIGSQFCNYVFEYTKKSFIPAFKLEPHPCVLFFHYHNNHHSIWLCPFLSEHKSSWPNLSPDLACQKPRIFPH